MSFYFIKGKGWRYEFILKGLRYTKAWFKTKREAIKAEAARREEVMNPEPKVETPTDMGFLELVNKRLDYVKAYYSPAHYRDNMYMARRWIKRWGKLLCIQVTQDMVQDFVLMRKKVSAYCANKEIRYLRATFNFGKKKNLITNNPVAGIEFFPVEKKIKYVPPHEDIDKVIEASDPDTQDYLLTIRETMARMSEINRLTWDDADFERKCVTLYTRKKRGGHLTPRKVPMTEKLYEVLSRRYSLRDISKPWVFWHTYWSSKDGEQREGPFKDRVKYFRFHALRHSGASIMDNSNVPIGAIQRILGHENRTTTEIYLHSIGEAERMAMAIFEQSRQNPHTNPHTGKK